MRIPIPGTGKQVHLGTVWATLSSTTKGTDRDDKLADARVGAVALRVTEGERVISAGAVAFGGSLPVPYPPVDVISDDASPKEIPDEVVASVAEAADASNEESSEAEEPAADAEVSAEDTTPEDAPQEEVVEQSSDEDDEAAYWDSIAEEFSDGAPQGYVSA